VSHCQLTGRPLDSSDRSDRGLAGLVGQGLVGQTIGFRRLSTPGCYAGLTELKKHLPMWRTLGRPLGHAAASFSSPSGSWAEAHDGTLKRAPRRPLSSPWNLAGRRSSPTDHKKRWSVPPRTAVACLSQADTLLQLNMNPEVAKLVSGHGFSRAANREHSQDFSPCLSRRVRRTCAPGLPSQGLKPSRWIRSARLKPCPDTKPVSQGTRLWKFSFAEAERHEPSRPRAGSLSRRKSVEAG